MSSALVRINSLKATQNRSWFLSYLQIVLMVDFIFEVFHSLPHQLKKCNLKVRGRDKSTPYPCPFPYIDKKSTECFFNKSFLKKSFILWTLKRLTKYQSALSTFYYLHYCKESVLTLRVAESVVWLDDYRSYSFLVAW